MESMSVNAAIKTWINGNQSDVIKHLLEIIDSGKSGIAERFGDSVWKKLPTYQDKNLFRKLLLSELIKAREKNIGG